MGKYIFLKSGKPKGTRCAGNSFKNICPIKRVDRKQSGKRIPGKTTPSRFSPDQLFCVFALSNDELVGCCGFRPFDVGAGIYERGFHLQKEFWHKGYDYEAAAVAIQYGFDVLRISKLVAGHHPENTASKALLTKLGFQYTGDNYYKPTGLYHPSYELRNNLR